jgi:hypothetical protein
MTDPAHLYRFADEYTRYPGGRLRKDGPFSGEAFRDDVLLPLLDGHQVVKFDLSGAVGFGSSFLDEAFGEIGKRLGLAACDKRMSFAADDDPALVELIWAKIAKAAKAA